MALRGVRVLELAGLAPAPFCGMILKDFGASVIRVDKNVVLERVVPHWYHPQTQGQDMDSMGRGKRSIALNLKNPQAISIMKKLAGSADVLLEPYRKGVMEKMGLGPEQLMKENPRLIYARLTGFGQSGPYADMAGHDINYVSVTGLLSMLGHKDGPPTPPINLLADFAGGGLMCAFGIALALFELTQSGKGQVIDANMVEGAAYTGSFIYMSRVLTWLWGQPRGNNVLDSGAHFYTTYETKDGRYMAVGAIEPQFYSQLLSLLGLDPEELVQFGDFDEKKKIFAERFKEKTMAEWTKIFDGKDACVTPVLTLDEAPLHPHNAARNSFVPSANNPGKYDPAPAPLLSRTPGTIPPGSRLPQIGEHSVNVLGELGYLQQDIKELINQGVVKQAQQKAQL